LPRTTGRRLEKIVANIERLLGEGVVVRERFRIRDAVSETLREFDVVITANDAASKVLVAIECKDHGRPLDQEVIEAFVTKCADSALEQRAMVSGSGFSAGAIKKASHYGILLLELVGEETIGWPSWFAPRSLGVKNTVWSIESGVLFDENKQPIPNFRAQGGEKILTGEGGSASILDLASVWMNDPDSGRGIVVPPGSTQLVSAIVDLPEMPTLIPQPGGKEFRVSRAELVLKLFGNDIKDAPLAPHALRRIDGETRGISLVSTSFSVGGKSFAALISVVKVDATGFRLSVGLVEPHR
jgi:hypothetical protein